MALRQGLSIKQSVQLVMANQADAEELLDSFDPQERREALTFLVREHGEALAEAGTNLNMHCHSFFSYNSEGYSPSHMAWESRKRGLYAAGLCDFDVLDGLEEFLQAGLMLKLRTLVSLETRAYMKEYAEADINSPGEQGVTYVMGAGFVRTPPAGSAEAAVLNGYRQRALERNVDLVRRINSRLTKIAVDYEKHVVPLTPNKTATERHIVKAYIDRATAVFEHPEPAAKYWSALLDKGFEETIVLMADPPSFEELVRAKLAKRGGIGYEQPSVHTFPPVDEFIAWVLSCDAVPMITWLDGTSAGEKDGQAMLELMMAKGAAALNIIPDRNWNISDPKTREVKTANLKAIIQTADSMGLPINIGTEMNKQGLPFADDLDGEALLACKESFTRGACILVGHALLLRYAGFSYTGAGTRSELPDVRKRNAFFEAVGRRPPLGIEDSEKLEDMGPEKALEWFRGAVVR